MPDFDPHAIIKRVAEVERPCTVYTGIDFTASTRVGPLVTASHGKDCVGGCGGTGRIVPFASLRAPACPKVGQQPHWHFGVHFNKKDDCKQGWVPEQNEAAAYWEVFKVLPKHIQQTIISSEGEIGQNTLLEAKRWVQS